jgi:hypothetical protein
MRAVVPSKRPRDTQRSKVYAWDQKIYPKNPKMLTLIECQQLVDELCGIYSVKASTVTDGRSRTRGCWSPRNNQIRMPRWTRHTNYMIHEIAHAIVGQWQRVEHIGNDPADGVHGPTFMRVYIDLLAKYGEAISLSASDLAKNAKDTGLKVAPASGLKPPSSSVQSEIAKVKAEIEGLRAELRTKNARLDELRAKL